MKLNKLENLKKFLCQGFHSTDSVAVYDSLTAGTPLFKHETHVINCIGCLAWSATDDLTILNMTCDQQDNDYDCGVYAVAFATALATGQNPCDLQLDGRRLRSHLIECLRQQRLTRFPQLDAARERHEPPYALTLPLFCYCRRGDAALNHDWDMAQCRGGCAGWYHRICADIPQKVFDGDVEWVCRLCTVNSLNEFQ